MNNIEQLTKFMIENDISETDLKSMLAKKRNMEKTLQTILEEFKQSLVKGRLSENTINDYMKEVNKFISYCSIENIADITQDKYIQYHTYLKGRKFKRLNKEQTSQIASTNKAIVIVNKFLKFICYDDCCIQIERVQKLSSNENAYTRNDFERLVRVAHSEADIKRAEKKLAATNTDKEKKKAQKALNQAHRNQARKYRTINLMIAIFGTGIRDNEIQFLTVEALKQNKMIITNKGKTRKVPIPRWIKQELNKYCEVMEITSGIIFYGRDKSKRLSHSQIWKDIQYLTGKAKIRLDKGHEHSLRRLFAKIYMEDTNNDIKSLQDILGHEDISTTLLYTQKSFNEQKANMQKMKQSVKVRKSA